MFESFLETVRERRPIVSRSPSFFCALKNREPAEDFHLLFLGRTKRSARALTNIIAQAGRFLQAGG